MPKLTINGTEIEVAEGTSVLQACEMLGIEIPRFCFHDRLSVAGSCRMCLVDIEKMPKPVASCTMPCSEGMVVHTDTESVREERQGVMEMLLLNHPLDCPVCDQGGECDLQDLAFAYGRDRCRSKKERRIVPDKDFGPLIKTAMTRCIHCTRCVRFMEEIAGSPELGGFARGEKMEITLGHEPPLVSEMSGNLVDICPVGALTSKPYAFTARPWELTKTDTIDVMDAVGCNIRVDARDGEVMRIVPRLHEDINEVWINDKTRFSYDGLKRQRLDRPYVRGGDGKLYEASWEEAYEAIAKKLHNLPPDKIGAIAGDDADLESVFALREIMHHIDSPHLDCRQDGASYDTSARAGYIMNSGIAGIEEADAILLIGCDPRHEATLVNTRIHKRLRKSECPVGVIGQLYPLGYRYHHIGYSPLAMRELMEGKHEFASLLEKAKKPLLVLGAGALGRADGAAVQHLARSLAGHFDMVRDGWNGFNVLQLVAGRTGALDVGFVPGAYGMNVHQMVRAASSGQLDVLYLLNADEIQTDKLGSCFVIYQGHHGDKGAQRADVILPGLVYTEKDASYVNTEGRMQRTRAAVPPLGSARADWRILTDLAKIIGRSLPYNDLLSLRKRIAKKIPFLAEVDVRSPAEWKEFGSEGKLSLEAFEPAIPNFYMTDVISRASENMARCSCEILPLITGEEVA